MRTWFNQVAAAAPCRRGVLRVFEAGNAHGKGRVTVPAFSGSPYALANVTGSPRAQSARRTVRAYRGRGTGGQASKGRIGTSCW